MRTGTAENPGDLDELDGSLGGIHVVLDVVVVSVGRTVEKSWLVVARVGGGKGLVKFDDEIWD